MKKESKNGTHGHHSETVISLADHVARIMKEKGFSHADIETRSSGNVDKSWISKLYAGVIASPRLDTLKWLAVALAVPVEELVRVSLKMPLHMDYNKDEQRLLNNFRICTLERRQALSDYAAYLVYLSEGGVGIPPFLQERIETLNVAELD